MLELNASPPVDTAPANEPGYTPDVTRVCVCVCASAGKAAPLQPNRRRPAAPPEHPHTARHAGCQSGAEVTADSGTHRGPRTASRSHAEMPLSREFTPHAASPALCFPNQGEAASAKPLLLPRDGSPVPAVTSKGIRQ